MDDSIPWIDCDPYSIPAMGPQRLFKTHMPFHWLPYSSEAKYIYVARYWTTTGGDPIIPPLKNKVFL